MPSDFGWTAPPAYFLTAIGLMRRSVLRTELYRTKPYDHRKELVMNTLTKPTIGIYIVPETDQENNHDKGTWIDLSDSLQGAEEQIKKYQSCISTRYAENWYRVQKSIGFYNIPIGEFEALTTIKYKADLIIEFGEVASHVYLKRKGNLVQTYYDLNGDWGKYVSLLDFGEWLIVGEIAEEKDDWYKGLALPTQYRPFIDVERYARRFLEENNDCPTKCEGKGYYINSEGTPKNKASRKFKHLNDLGEWLFVSDVASEPEGWYDGVPLPPKYRPYVDFEGYAHHFLKDEANWSVTLSTGEFFVFWEFDPSPSAD